MKSLEHINNSIDFMNFIQVLVPKQHCTFESGEFATRTKDIDIYLRKDNIARVHFARNKLDLIPFSISLKIPFTIKEWNFLFYYAAREIILDSKNIFKHFYINKNKSEQMLTKDNVNYIFSCLDFVKITDKTFVLTINGMHVEYKLHYTDRGRSSFLMSISRDGSKSVVVDEKYNSCFCKSDSIFFHGNRIFSLPFNTKQWNNMILNHIKGNSHIVKTCLSLVKHGI